MLSLCSNIMGPSFGNHMQLQLDIYFVFCSYMVKQYYYYYYFFFFFINLNF